MNSPGKILFFVVILSGFFFLKGAYSFFSDSADSTNNTFTASSCFPSGNHIVVNEVLYDVDSGHTGQGSESRWEWIELYNPTGSTVDLTGWSISDGNDSDPLPGTPSIPPCSFAIVSGSSEAELEDQTDNGGNWIIPDGTLFITLTDSNIGNGLHNNNDAVFLKNNLSTDIDKMSYGTDTTGLNPPATDVATGHSLERDPDGTDTDTAADFVDRTTPQPGL